MLKNNKKQCKKLYKYYKREFNKCTKGILKNTPNFITGLEALMLYLQYMQDTVALTKSLIINKEKVNSMFLTLNIVLDNYLSYKNCLLAQTAILKDDKLSKTEKDEQIADLLKKSKLYWTIL